MRVIFAESARPEQPTAVTIGAYDGVHKGHRVLIDDLRARARARGLQSAVVTFDRHPAAIVRPESAPLLLTDLEQKLELLAGTGLDRAVVVTFDEARSQQPAEDFVTELVVKCLNARVVVVGSDFHFGHDRLGNVALLEQMGADHGFDVAGLELIGDPAGAVSSTRIRQLLSAGDVESAAELLGRHHEVRGVVVRGDARGGSTLGYPTANVKVPVEILVPSDGIYAGWFSGDAGDDRPAAVYVGTRPTFQTSQPGRVLEAHLIDFSGDLYGDRARVRFVRRLRGDRRFDSAEELALQMGRDVSAARTALRSL